MGRRTPRRPSSGSANSGMQLAIDDFGIGYSSLGSLQTLPGRRAEDRPHLHQRHPGEWRQPGAGENDHRACPRLDLAVIAEGIETRSQHDALLAEGCLQGQGYLYGKPMPAAKVEAVLLSARVRPAAALT